MIASPRQLLSGACALTLAAGLAACGEAASTSSFKGESHNVAQGVSDFQSDVTGREQKKLCQDDLAKALVARLQSTGGCQAVLKQALDELDSVNLTIQSIAVKGSTAQARVKSIYSGKNRVTTLTLVKEGSRWKVSGVSSGPAGTPVSG
jgi:hypothetical protein